MSTQSPAFRTLRARHPALRDDIGDLSTRRPLPGPGLDHLDPFLFLNHHGPQTYRPGNRGLPFGPHPHRGFATLTFILEGELAHLDSSGHESVIKAGGVQWMSAGSGLVHAEISPDSFRRQGGPLEILQLWVNLPARLKMTPPLYLGLQQAELPRLEQGGVAIDLIAGRWAGQEGPVRPPTDLSMSVLRFAPGAALRPAAPATQAVFLYVVGGGLEVSGAPVPAATLAELNADGDALDLRAGPAGAVVLFGCATPYNEPIVAHGPFVMNTEAEIREAIRDYQAGKFGTVRL